MSVPSDYTDGMYTPLSISDAEAEALLDGADGTNGDLADVAEVVAAIRAIGSYNTDKDYSHLIAAAALESRTTPVARYAAAQASSTPREWTARVVPRVAVGAAALIMLVLSSAGLAYAANGAKPGDMLYGLDRAAEVIGIWDGGPSERYDEAQALIAAGEMPGGLALATEILDRTPGGQDASPAVAEAVIRLEQVPPGPGSHVADQVGDLLTYIHTATIAGFVDIDKVSGLAQQIGGPPEVPPGLDGEDPGNSGEAPGQTGETPGQPGETPSGDTSEASDDSPGNSDDAPGQTGETPGQSGETPGQTEDTSESSEDPPGQSEDPPGQSEDPPGQGPPEVPPGPPASIPGSGTPGGS